MPASGRLRQIAGDVAGIPRAVLPDALELVDRLAVDEARRATGDGRMSGGATRGAKLRTVARRRTSRSSAGAEIRGVPAAGWALLEGGARPHRIGRPGRVMAGALGHPVAVPMRHPGHAGRRTWSLVAARAADQVPDLYRDAVTRAVR